MTPPTLELFQKEPHRALLIHTFPWKMAQISLW